MVILDDFGWNWGTCNLIDISPPEAQLWNIYGRPVCSRVENH